MNALAFYAAAALTIGAAVGATFLKNTKLAAMALLGALLGVALLFVIMKAGLLAALMLVVAAGGSAGLLHLAYWRTQEAATPEPSEERRYWAGLVSVLAFVLVFRVVAASEWGTQDYSKLVSNGFGALPWLAVAVLVILGALGAWTLWRKESA
ncbi:MAG TPA: hypothetical protein V6D05_08670 [Stenomitos sp.]